MAEESEKYQNKVGLPVKSFEMNLNGAMHKNLTPKIQECLIMFSRYSEYYMIMCSFDGSQTSLSMPRWKQRSYTDLKTHVLVRVTNWVIMGATVESILTTYGRIQSTAFPWNANSKKFASTAAGFSCCTVSKKITFSGSWWGWRWWIWARLYWIRSQHVDTTDPLRIATIALHMHITTHSPTSSPWVLHNPVIHSIFWPISYN